MPSSRSVSSRLPEPHRRGIAKSATRPHGVGRGLVGITLTIIACPLESQAQEAIDRPSSVPAKQKGNQADQDSKTILLVRTAYDDDVVNRVRVELHASGWHIIELNGPDGSGNPGLLARLASEYAAAAVVRVEARIGQIDIFIGRSWGDIEETLRSENGQFDAQVLALRTTEALRAHGLDLGPTQPGVAQIETGRGVPSAQRAAQDANSPPDAAHKLPRQAAIALRGIVSPNGDRLESTRGLWFEAAPAATGSPGGLGLAFSAWMGLRIELSSTWSLAATGLLPMTSQQVNEPQGQASVSSGFVGLSTEIAWLRRSFGSEAAGLGAAALVTSMKGTLSLPGYSDASDTVVTIAPYSYLRTGVVLGPDWRIFGLVLGGTSIPKVRVAFGDTVVRTWGQPFGLLAMGIEWRGIKL